MIKIEKKVIEAYCDACCKSLLDMQALHNVNYGLMRTSFGYGSRLDDIGQPREWHLCEDCWKKALAAVGVKVE